MKTSLSGQVNELGQGFTVINDCLTPTMKLRRPQLQKRYQKATPLPDMYVYRYMYTDICIYIYTYI